MGEREGGGIPEENFFVVDVAVAVVDDDADDFVVAVVSFVVVSFAPSNFKLPGETITGFGRLRPLLLLLAFPLAFIFFLAHALVAGDPWGGGGGGPEGRGGRAGGADLARFILLRISKTESGAAAVVVVVAFVDAFEVGAGDLDRDLYLPLL